MSITFDLRRVSTVVSPVGRVHITVLSGLETLCGFKVPRSWSENLSDRQPNCTTCERRAALEPIHYPFTKRVTPPLAVPEDSA